MAAMKYQSRPIRFIGLVEGEKPGNPWKAKLYGVTARPGGEFPEERLVESGRIAVSRILDSLAQLHSIPEVPVLIAVASIHEDVGADFLLLGRWEASNELQTEVFKLAASRQRRIQRLKGSEMPLCTWDLAILAAERNAWVEKVLKYPTPAGIEEYLRTVLNATI